MWLYHEDESHYEVLHLRPPVVVEVARVNSADEVAPVNSPSIDLGTAAEELPDIDDDVGEGDTLTGQMDFGEERVGEYIVELVNG